VSEVKVEMKKMKLADLKPADYNPRRISEEAFEGLGQSISRFGMLSHIVWNKRSGNIVGGHQRFKQLREMGETETDVVVVDLDDNEEVALNITMNNREVRGDFTKDVIEQLRVSEAQLGSAFKQIGLLDLFEHLQSRGFDKKKKEKKETTGEKPGEKPPERVNDEPDDIIPPADDKPQAVITCPKCRSQWKLTDNKVVFNAVTGTGNEIGAKNAV
jgi:ParB-like chromosome segregation protein Spo0J